MVFITVWGRKFDSRPKKRALNETKRKKFRPANVNAIAKRKTTRTESALEKGRKKKKRGHVHTIDARGRPLFTRYLNEQRGAERRPSAALTTPRKREANAMTHSPAALSASLFLLPSFFVLFQ